MGYWTTFKSKLEKIKTKIISYWRDLIANTRKLVRLNVLITGLATVVIAIATCVNSCIANKLSKIENQQFENSLKQIKAEFRPYLTVQLVSFGSYLKLDSDKKLFISCCRGNYLDLPITISNIGKIPALNVEAKYDGPVQYDVPFESEDEAGDIAPNGKRKYLPAVNVSGIYNNKKAKQEFKTVISVDYHGNEEIDSRTYTTELTLRIEKRKINNEMRFYLVGSNTKFKIKD